MSNSIRETRQRKAIRKVLTASQCPLTAREIHLIAAKREPTLGIATVYRNIRILVEEGFAEELCLPGQFSRYTAKRTDKHAILYCKKSKQVQLLEGHVISVDMPPLPEYFVLEGYELVLHGQLKSGHTFLQK